MNSLVKEKNNPVDVAVEFDYGISIVEEQIRKSYLSRISEMKVAPVEMLELEYDLIDNVRLYHLSEVVYKKGESAKDKFTTVFNALSPFNATVFVVIDSDGNSTDFYIGVRNNESNEEIKRSTVTLGDTLKNTLIGQFPGTRIEERNRKQISDLSKKIKGRQSFAAVSVLGSDKKEEIKNEDEFVQGMEKLGIAMAGRKYIGIFIAQNQSSSEIQQLREEYQEVYTRLTPFQKEQISDAVAEGRSHKQSFFELNKDQRAAYIAQKVADASVGALTGAAAGVASGAFVGSLFAGVGAAPGAGIGAAAGATIGAVGKIVAPSEGVIQDFIPKQQVSETRTSSKTVTVENKKITDLLKLIDDNLKRINECESYGMWKTAAYFISDDMSSAEIAASNYRSLMSGKDSGREVSAINSWRKKLNDQDTDYLSEYLSRFVHPEFCYGFNDECEVITNAATSISGKELGLHLGLPRSTITGLPVIEHAEFGKEVISHNLVNNKTSVNPEDYIVLGNVFDLGQRTTKQVHLDNNSLNMHTFITGSTGSGKSNTVYQMLCELHQDDINFLVIEPAKGEYKDVFGSWNDVNVFSTNPNVAEMVTINPFMFPESIHVLEHVDGLVEIFSVCWPLYDAMPAFLKEAILKSYEYVGWDLGSSTYEGETLEYPDFDILVEQLDKLIEASDYASDIKSNYRGALITRVKSLTVGLNKFLFNSNQTPYEKIFDENCILDISRVKSSETKALIMGIMVYALNEYRMDHKTGNNRELKHVTVMEEAHNLLKNTEKGGAPEIVGKSVEMITQTIAEIRTYGEGFIIVDQSPSSVDIAAIKNTNTKIVLRTPEANDREAIGRSIGLSDDQVNEIAKLPSGVAVVYQNDWINPVLTQINKADVKEIPYRNKSSFRIISKRLARTIILRVLMDPWIGDEEYSEQDIQEAISVLDISSRNKRKVESLVNEYLKQGGKLIWREEELGTLSKLVQGVLEIKDEDYLEVESQDDLVLLVKSKIVDISDTDINEVCFYLTYGGDAND